MKSFLLLLSLSIIIDSNKRELVAVRPTEYLVSKNPKLPVVIRFDQTPEYIQDIFRQQFGNRGIDTISWREGLHLYEEELKKALEMGYNERRLNMQNIRYYMVSFRVSADNEHINKIAWKAYGMPDRRPDTTSHYFNIPDSLKVQPVKAVAACLDLVLKSRELR